VRKLAAVADRTARMARRRSALRLAPGRNAHERPVRPDARAVPRGQGDRHSDRIRDAASGIAYLLMIGQDVGLAAEQILNGLYNSVVLLAVPPFILAANLRNAGTMSERLASTSRRSRSSWSTCCSCCSAAFSTPPRCCWSWCR
jgi:hypothetical protein